MLLGQSNLPPGRHPAILFRKWLSVLPTWLHFAASGAARRPFIYRGRPAAASPFRRPRPPPAAAPAHGVVYRLRNACRPSMTGLSSAGCWRDLTEQVFLAASLTVEAISHWIPGGCPAPCRLRGSSTCWSTSQPPIREWAPAWRTVVRKLFRSCGPRRPRAVAAFAASHPDDPVARQFSARSTPPGSEAAHLLAPLTAYCDKGPVSSTAPGPSSLAQRAMRGRLPAISAAAGPERCASPTSNFTTRRSPSVVFPAERQPRPSPLVAYARVVRFQALSLRIRGDYVDSGPAPGLTISAGTALNVLPHLAELPTWYNAEAPAQLAFRQTVTWGSCLAGRPALSHLRRGLP